jgi:hypothetical protein
MGWRKRRVLMNLLAVFGSLATIQLPVAHADPPVTKAPACIKRGWPETVTCGTTACFVSSCGEGKCPYCFIDGMENLAIRGWAAYTCLNGESVTGKALLFQTLPFNARLGPFCG